MRSFLPHENRVSMCDMNFQWYSLHPSISSSTSRSTAPRLRPVSVVPELLISVPSWYGDTKDQRADLRCSHQEFRHSASRLPKAAVAWWAWTVQCFFGLYAAPMVTLTCDEMNYTVDCFVRCSRCVTSKLEDVRIFASSQSHAKLRFATAVIGRFSIVPKSVLARAEKDGFFDFRGMYPAKTLRLRAADRVLRFSKHERARVHRTGFPHATKTFSSPDQCA